MVVVSNEFWDITSAPAPVSAAAAATVALWYTSLGLATTSALLSLLAAVLAPYPQYVHMRFLGTFYVRFFVVAPIINVCTALSGPS